MRYKAQVRNGVAMPYKPKAYQEELKAYEGLDIDIDIKPHDPEASKDQWGYYWSILKWAVTNTEAYAGNTSKVLDKEFCNMFLAFNKMIILNGVTEERSFVESKSSLKKADAAFFIQRVIQEVETFAGVQVPPPKHAIEEKYRTVVKTTVTEIDDNSF